MRLIVFILATLLAATACTASGEDPPLNTAFVEVALDICPMMWQWQLAMGSVMNDMSYQAFREENGANRLSLYLETMDRARAVNDSLRARLTALPTNRYQQFFASEISKGLDLSDEVIDDTETMIMDSYQETTPSYHEIMPPIFLAFEKVIDLPKPELASYGDPDLIPAFKSVVQCQHGVKDANDGVPRYVPLNPT